MESSKTYEKKASNKTGAKRFVFVAVSILMEAALVIGTLTKLNAYAPYINTATVIVGFVIVLGLYSRNETSAMKMPWIILILVFPVPGTVLYLMIGLNGSTHRMRRRYELVDADLLPLLPENKAVQDRLMQQNPAAAGISAYLYNRPRYPVYQNTALTYYPDAALALEAQLQDIAQAQHFIFMEYHAIENKQAWAQIQAALEERVRAGVEVRVFYDDLGSIFFVNRDFAKQLEQAGIHCRVFNPLVPWLNLFLNNRDHRKITVIDGKIGYTGGYNLADEYFNLTHPYGRWKDTGIRLQGEAVRSMTVTFLEMWNAVSDRDENDPDYTVYLSQAESENSSGFVQPYADSPMDRERVGEEVYISMANKAVKYCWFITPYLIISDEMAHALTLAAKRGVDVRVITPGIPDKKMIYDVTRSFYNELARDGVRIFEWTPGFCHAKMSIADDRMATVGTINLDFRSLYHHFENGCFMADCKEISAIRADFENTFAQSTEVTEQYRSGRSRFLRISQAILRLFAGLM